MKLIDVNLDRFSTQDLIAIWNSYQGFTPHDGREIKSFANREVGLKRVEKLLQSIYYAHFVKHITEKAGIAMTTCENILDSEPKLKAAIRQFSRKSPVFENEDERIAYVTSRYAAKTERFRGRKSKFANHFLYLTRSARYQVESGEIISPFRKGSVIENSFKLIANNPGILYEKFRLDGGRSTDLKYMLDKNIVKVIKVNEH